MHVQGVRHRDYRSRLAGAPGLGGVIRRTVQAIARPRCGWCQRGLYHEMTMLEAADEIGHYLAWEQLAHHRRGLPLVNIYQMIDIELNFGWSDVATMSKHRS
jgi:hypothetical protein